MMNSYTVQFSFYFGYINLQISIAFFASTMFSKVKTASGLILGQFSCECFCYFSIYCLVNIFVQFFSFAVVGYIYVFASGLLGYFLFQGFVEKSSFPSKCSMLKEFFFFAFAVLVYFYPYSALSSECIFCTIIFIYIYSELQCKYQK